MMRGRGLVAAVIVAAAGVPAIMVGGAGAQSAPSVVPSGEVAGEMSVEAPSTWTAPPVVGPVSIDAGAPPAGAMPFDAATQATAKANPFRAAPQAELAAGADVSAPAPQAPATLVTFGGLNRATSVNNGSFFVPPDTTLGASPTKVIEATNSAIRISTTAGAVVATNNLNTFMGAPTATGLLFDPKVYYDRNAINPRFWVVALQQSGRNDNIAANNVSRVWVAISRSTSPGALSAGSWCRYNLEGRRDIGTANESWADYPGVGAGRDAFLITANQFTFPSGSFTHAFIRAINKAVANNARACPAMTSFSWRASSTVGDATAFTLQPVQHYTSPSTNATVVNPAYLVSHVATGGTDNRLRIWRIRNVASGAPVLGNVTIVGTSYSLPPDAVQPGGGPLIDSGDVRMLQAAGVGNSVSAVNTTGCQFGVGPLESCVQYGRLNIGITATNGLSAVFTEQRVTGFGENTFAHHPSVAMNANQQAAGAWIRSSVGVFSRSESVVKNAGGSWSPFGLTGNGTCTQLYNRSGDYNGAQTDPGGVSFWIAGERTAVLAGLAGCNWTTQVAKVTA